MNGIILKISSNDLYGNVDERQVIVFACFKEKFPTSFLYLDIPCDKCHEDNTIDLLQYIDIIAFMS